MFLNEFVSKTELEEESFNYLFIAVIAFKTLLDVL